jgi:hypothetical protein
MGMNTSAAALTDLIQAAEQELAVALLMAGCQNLTQRETVERIDRLHRADADLEALREMVAE